MIPISFPLLGITINCMEFESHQTPARQGGWVSHPPEIVMTAVFRGRPEVMHKIAMRGITIREMTVYAIPDAPPILFGYVVIYKEEHITGNAWRIHMKALRMSYNGTTRPNKERKCKCGNRIEYWYTSSLMSNVGIQQAEIDKIWDNDLFRFMCCSCFRKRNSPLQPQSHGEYITVSWWQPLPRQEYLGEIIDEDSP